MDKTGGTKTLTDLRSIFPLRDFSVVFLVTSNYTISRILRTFLTTINESSALIHSTRRR